MLWSRGFAHGSWIVVFCQPPSIRNFSGSGDDVLNDENQDPWH
jgi:hypothetical protein